MEENKNQITVVKKCPVCGTRLFDKVSPTSGLIKIKCGQCRKIVTINLALRRVVPENNYQGYRPRV